MSEWYRYITDREYRVRTDKNEGVYLSTFPRLLRDFNGRRL